MANFSMYGVCDFSYGFAIHEIYWFQGLALLNIVYSSAWIHVYLMAISWLLTQYSSSRLQSHTKIEVCI
jgi:hypothetical protein